MIRAAVAVSIEKSSAVAGLEAARQIVQSLEGHQADWCIAFVTAEHGEHIHALTGALSEALGTPYVVGCSAAGVLGAGKEIERGPAIVVLAVASDQVRATPFMFDDDGDLGMTAGVRVGQRLLSSRDSDDLLLVWPDPFHVRPDRLLHGLDAVLGSVPVVGGAASSRRADGSTFQFCGSESGPGAVSGVRLGGRFRHAVGVTQGCRALGRPHRVTRSHENLILELDSRPALAALRDQAPQGLLDDLEWGLNFLFVGLLPDPGVPEIKPGEYLVRNIVTADPDTGVLGIADTVEEGQFVVFAHRDAESARLDLQRMLERVAPERTGLDYRLGLYFNCLARGSSLYETEGTDSALLARALPGVPLLGFFCNAEIGPLRGVNHVFTYTGVLLLIAE